MHVRETSEPTSRLTDAFSDLNKIRNVLSDYIFPTLKCFLPMFFKGLAATRLRDPRGLAVVFWIQPFLRSDNIRLGSTDLTLLFVSRVPGQNIYPLALVIPGAAKTTSPPRALSTRQKVALVLLFLRRFDVDPRCGVLFGSECVKQVKTTAQDRRSDVAHLSQDGCKLYSVWDGLLKRLSSRQSQLQQPCGNVFYMAAVSHQRRP
ncbi:hypothetical protein Hypma_000114 [Hypsizygus marmoreus]|uniref:Uncharacterized protein n=1 Tax=Hypsizygus marmoreus TaxID=39966 RepID=A0A369K8S3_HYPMA|nr:hypothetical protein Hypma_000114 [Hypsizygus marmoreus]